MVPIQQDLPFLLKKKMSGRGRGHHRGRSKGRNTHKPKGNGKGKGGNNRPPRADNRKALFATATAANATKFLTFNEVEEVLIRKLKKTAELQDVAQAIESRQEWDEDAHKPVRELSKVDVFPRKRD